MKKCFKKCRKFTDALMTEELKIIRDIEVIDPNNNYDFDGEDFVATIKTLGKGIDQREKEQMKTKSWQDFRDRNSVVYYFWRLSS